MAVMKPSEYIKKIRGKYPRQLKDNMCYYTKNGNFYISNPYDKFTFNYLWVNQNEFESGLVDFLTEELNVNLLIHAQLETVTNLWLKIYNDYGERYIFDSFFEFIVNGWDGTIEEYENVEYFIEKNIYSCIKENRYKWGNLFKSTILEFNPLWNVDGVTGEIRETTHTGTDASEHSGSDTLTKSGDDSTTRTGNETLSYNGEKTNAQSGMDTNTISHTTTESTSFYDTEKNETVYGKSETESFNQRNDERTYNSVKDEINYNSENETTYDSTIERILNLKDKDLFMQIRQGNIGVTTTTKLLTEFREYINFNLLNIVAKDIVESITRGVY